MEKMLLDCPNCGKDQPAHRPESTVSHGFHAFMTFLTCGLWVVIWIICAAKGPDRSWKCVKCGEVVETPTKWWQWVLIFLFIGILNVILAPFVLPLIF